MYGIFDKKNNNIVFNVLSASKIMCADDLVLLLSWEAGLEASLENAESDLMISFG